MSSKGASERRVNRVLRTILMSIVAGDPTSALLEPAFMAKLDQLALVSRKIFAGKLRGERLTKRRGESVEFADYRSYVSGDDLRFLDWNIYDGPSNLPATGRQFAIRHPQPGIVLLLSDFYEKGGFDEGLRYLLGRKDELD